MRIMPDFTQLLEDLKRSHDEIELKIHLGLKDVQNEPSEIEKHWGAFESKAELGKSDEDVSDTVKILGSELKEAYVQIRKAL